MLAPAQYTRPASTPATRERGIGPLGLFYRGPFLCVGGLVMVFFDVLSVQECS